jgi:hypothetical protein
MTGGTTNSNGTNPRVQSRAGTHNNLLNFKLVVPSATWMSTSIAAVRSNIHWDATYRVGHRMNATEPEALDLVWLQNMAKFPTRGQRDLSQQDMQMAPEFPAAMLCWIGFVGSSATP